MAEETLLSKILKGSFKFNTFEEFEDYFRNEEAITLSALIMLFSTGESNNNSLEGDDYDMDHVEQKLLYAKLIKKHYAGSLPVTSDAHVVNRFWVPGNKIAEVLLLLYRSRVAPCDHMNRFIEKCCSKESVGLFAAVARELLQTEEFTKKANQALLTNSPEELKGISKAVDSDPNLALLKQRYIANSKAKKSSARDIFTRRVKKEMFQIIRSEEFSP